MTTLAFRGVGDGELMEATVVAVRETVVDIPCEGGTVAIWACLIIAAEVGREGCYYPALWFEGDRPPVTGEVGRIAWIDDGTWRGWRFLRQV